MGKGAHRVATVAMVAAVLVTTTGVGWGVARASAGSGFDLRRVVHPAEDATRPRAAHRPKAHPAAPRVKPVVAPPGQQKGHPRPRHVQPAAHARRPAPLPERRPTQVPAPGPRILGPGDHSPQVRTLQARLRQIAWYFGNVSDDYDTQTTAAVKGFQAKREIAVTGYVDQRTLDRLAAMTHTPTADELANRQPGDLHTDAALDPRCTTGRAICVDKTSSTLRWVVDGKVQRTMAVRFGAAYSPTREGLFHVGWKSRDHVSHLYGSSMPYAMFFSGGQAVHYSSDFAARGYAGASHGCVNVRDLAGISWLFDQVAVGDKVVIYWS